MRVVDPGHIYDLDRLDGDGCERLVFVKRDDPPDKFPGNTGRHAGTTTQEVLRALVDRARYVEGQQAHPENGEVIALLRRALHALESRAARVRGDVLRAGVDGIEAASTCATCGHVDCTRHPAK